MAGKAGGFTLAGPSKGPDRERKPKNIIVKVLVTPVIPAVVLSGNPDFVRFLKAGYPIKTFGYDKRILHDKCVLTSCSRNCQTLGVYRQSRGFTLGQLIDECVEKVSLMWSQMCRLITCFFPIARGSKPNRQT